MLFTTKKKVELSMIELMIKLEHLDGQLCVYEDQQKVLGSMFGPAPEISEMRGAHEEIYNSLGEALDGLRSGTFNFREIMPQLKPLSAAIAHMKSILDQADVESAKGKAAFKAKFGK